MRVAVVLGFSVVVALVLWGVLPPNETPDRSTRPARAIAPTKPEIEFPLEPAAFAEWWIQADDTARRQATAALKKPGPALDVLIAALITEQDCEDMFRMLGDRALPILEQVCRQPGGEEDYIDLSPRRNAAFRLIMQLAGPEEQLRFMVGCLEGDRPLQYAVAERVGYPPEEGTGPAADGALRRALAQALAALPAPVETYGIYSGPPSLRMALSDALLATLDREGHAIGELLADADPMVRVIAAQISRDWIESEVDWPEEKEKHEREAEVHARGREAVRLMLPLLADPETDVRHAALRALAKLGEDGIDVPRAPLVDCLANPSEDGVTRGLAALALAGAGDDATAELLPYLTDPDATVRAMVVRGLNDEMDWDRPDPALRPRFLAALEDGDAAVRAAAAAALGAFATTPDASCRQVLVVGLDDPAEEVRVACADALNQYHARPVEAIAHLEQWLAHGSEKERNTAIRLAGSLGAKAAPLEASLAPLALRGDPEARLSVLRALLPCARRQATLEIALDILKDDDRALRLKAAKILAQRFGGRRRVDDALEQALADTDTGVRTVAAEALAKRGLATAKVISACRDVIGSRETASWDRRTAVLVLARYGRAAAGAVPALLRAFDDPWIRMDKVVVVEAFALLPALADLTVPALVTRAVGGDGYAVAALVRMGSVAEPHLGQALADLPAAKRSGLETALAKQRQAATQNR